MRVGEGCEGAIAAVHVRGNGVEVPGMNPEIQQEMERGGVEGVRFAVPS